LVGVVVSGVFAYFAVKGVHVDRAWDAAREARPGWLVAALLLLGAAFFVRAVRWRSMFDRGRRPPLGAASRALFLGYLFNNLLPLRAGEPIRVVSLSRSARVPLAETAATAVTERMYDLLSLLVLLFLILPWLPDIAWVNAAAALAAALVLAVAAAALVVARFGHRPISFAVRQVARVPGVPGAKLQHSPENTIHGLVGIRRPSIALEAFLWTTASWLIAGAAFWLVTVAFGLSLSPLAGLLIVIAVGLGMILPSSPAAVGVFEGATVLALSAYDVEQSAALSCALVLHALNVLPFYVLALPILRRRSPLRRRGAGPSTASEHDPADAGESRPPA
jgi:uncharacterized protein (TIRG00374 family)